MASGARPGSRRRWRGLIRARRSLLFRHRMFPVRGAARGNMSAVDTGADVDASAPTQLLAETVLGQAFWCRCAVFKSVS